MIYGLLVVPYDTLQLRPHLTPKLNLLIYLMGIASLKQELRIDLEKWELIDLEAVILIIFGALGQSFSA